ncbi:MAG TPA: nucleotidyltransferase domain-containing protein, partial [Stellaceae bacterium]
MSSGNSCSNSGHGPEYQRRPIVVKRPMSTARLDDPILKRFRAALDALYGERIERVVLFGSRARGDANADSDYDIAVFLYDMTDRRREVRQIVPIVADIIDETGAVIHALPCPAGSYENRTSL